MQNLESEAYQTLGNLVISFQYMTTATAVLVALLERKTLSLEDIKTKNQIKNTKQELKKTAGQIEKNLDKFITDKSLIKKMEKVRNERNDLEHNIVLDIGFKPESYAEIIKRTNSCIIEINEITRIILQNLGDHFKNHPDKSFLENFLPAIKSFI